jgi:uncharacterized Zn-binding protein involved in type VI secretion
MPEIIRQGDSTSHGGTVLEGSPTDICMGKPIAYMGHKVHCPKCRGTYPIIEGVLTSAFYGKGVAVAGMKTSCGATLIASQFTDTVEWSSGAGGGTAAAGGASEHPAKAAASSALGSASAAKLSSRADNSAGYDEQTHLASTAIEGIPYLIETTDGRKITGRATDDGLLPRIETDSEAEYTVYWGDEALAKSEGAGA